MLLRRDVERLRSDSRLTKGERHAEPVVPAEPVVAVGLVRVVGQQVLVLERDARLVVLDLLAPLGGRAEREVLDGAPRDGEGDEPRAGRRRARTGRRWMAATTCLRRRRTRSRAGTRGWTPSPP